jgi:4-hydroxy-4-methyl-2-oxoglutarate aldolase
MLKLFQALMVVALLGGAIPAAHAQLGLFSKEQRIDYTREWKGERFPDGRPRVSDELLERMKQAKCEIAWGTMKELGYKSQIEGGWRVIHPEKRLVGRVVTAVFMPIRPDMDAVIKDHGKQEGRQGAGENSWVINTLQENDVLVVDMFGKVEDGTFAGDRLGTSIFTRTKTGFVVNGGIRDSSGISDVSPDIRVYVRDFHPSAIADVMLMGINVPIRIGRVTVMPGDVILSDPEGLTFVPPHLAQRIADESEMANLTDDWSHEMVRIGKYGPSDVDAKWTKKMVDEFNKYAESKGSKLRQKYQE